MNKIERTTEENVNIILYGLSFIAGAIISLFYYPFLLLYIYDNVFLKFTNYPMNYGDMFLLDFVIGIVIMVFIFPYSDFYLRRKQENESAENGDSNNSKEMAIFLWTRLLALGISHGILIIVLSLIK